MSKIKLAGAGAKYAGKKISEVLKRLKRNKTAKKSKANVEKAGRGTKSISRYNIRARARDEQVIPVKGQSQKGSSFKPHKVRGTGPGSRVGFETRESWRDEMERMYSDISISKFFKKSTGGDINKPMKKTLSEKQKKIASKAPPYDQIGGNDFAVLKKEKAKGRGMGLQDESVKPGKVQKAALGVLALGMGAKKLKEKLGDKDMLMPLGIGATAMKAKKMKEMLGKKYGGKIMKAKRGKLIPLRSDPTKAISSVKPSTGGKGGPPSKTPKEAGSAVDDFLKRRKQLMGFGKATRLGRTAALVGAGLSAAAAGIGKAVKEYKDYKSVKNRNKKMLRDYREQKKPGVPSQKTQDINKALNRLNSKKMGGGMMMKPMGYSKGTMIMARGCKLGRKKATKIT